jgi:hypothetical protein
MGVQWVHLAPGKLLVAGSRSAWIQRPEPGAIGFSAAMPARLPSSVATTRRLLDGAIALAEREAPQVEQPPMTARRWAWYLASQWYCAHHSVALLPNLIRRYEALERADLASFARLKLEEEQGHDEFALSDLSAFGYDADSLVRSVPAVPSVEALVEHGRACALGPNPTTFLGYVYALERRVLRLTDEWFASLADVLPRDAPVATGLRAHATEFDREHVEEAVTFIATLPAGDRTSIVQASHRTTEIACTPLPHEFPSESQLESFLGPHRQREGVTP